jgi:hypothetical protein
MGQEVTKSVVVVMVVVVVDVAAGLRRSYTRERGY